jgi:hypothetical protein
MKNSNSKVDLNSGAVQVQTPPEKGRPNPMSKEIGSGRWVPGIKVQDPMLNKFCDRRLICRKILKLLF